MTHSATLEWEPTMKTTSDIEWGPVSRVVNIDGQDYVVGPPAHQTKPRKPVKPYDPESIQLALEHIEDMHRFYMLVKPVGIKKKTKGGIILADTTVADQEWTHGIVQVCMLGPSFYKGKRFEDQGLTPEHGPQVGQLVYIQPRTPIRFKIKGELFIAIADDGPVLTFNPDNIENISFMVG